MLTLLHYIFIKETPPVVEEQRANVSADNETSSNGFIKYLDLSKIPLCVSTCKTSVIIIFL